MQMNPVKINPKERPTNETEIETYLLEEIHGDFYSTLKRWEALYPHTYGDLILEEILEDK